MSNPTRIPWKRLGNLTVTGLIIGGVSACVDEGPISPPMDTPAATSAQVPPGLQDRGPLERVQFIHYKRGFAKPPWAPGGGDGGTGTSTCYAFIANGAGWKNAEPWQVYNGSDDGITAQQLRDRVAASLDGWEAEAGANIAGDGNVSSGQAVNLNATDGRNVVQFGSISSSGAIAVTNVWGYFRGPANTREIVEWDMILDDGDFSWSLTGAPGAMDVWNIVAHESGHAIGMDHPSGSCTEETMYAYASDGETQKRTLNAGDIAGIQALY
jgi:hypothetical protein